MSNYEYDLIVLGTGPGGEGAAMQAVKNGKRVAAIEKYSRVGGGCTHWGTIPSKALRYAIFQLTEFNNNRFYRDLSMGHRVSFPMLREGAARIIQEQEELRSSFFTRNGVPIYHGTGSFVDANTVQVRAQDAELQTLTADKIVIATGSRPYRPANIDFNHPRIFDSDKILSLDRTPKSIVIYGAGVIGCEYASMFRNLGIKVNLFNTRTQLLQFLDDEIIDALSYHLRDTGVVIRHNEEYESIQGMSDGVVVSLKSGKQTKGDILLWANGRTGNTDQLNLPAIGLEANSRGQLQVNSCFQTDVPNIYAVGDVIGFPSLASAAYSQGRSAASHICDDIEPCRMTGEIPTGIYTSPEISSVGKTERELTEESVPYEVGHAQFKSLARAQITGRRVGMLKLLFHRETLEILGIHCFGPNASEIVHIGQAIMAQEVPANSLNYFMDTTFNYPTMAEAYRVAALNGYNRLF